MKLSRLIHTTLLGLALALPTIAASKAIVVGGKNFTEQQLMAEMTTQLLEAHDFDVDTRAGMGSVVLRKAQENGQIDVVWEYTGTSLITYNKIEERLSPEETYNTVKELDGEKGLIWLNPSEANNTYSLAMRSADVQEKSIETLSDLAAAINDGQTLTFASNAEFAARPDGLKPLQKTYGFEFGRANVKRMDTGLTYQALRDEQVDVSLVFATDGRIPAFDFVVLKDDKDFFPAYALTPVVRAEVLEQYPELEEILNALSAKLDDLTMAKLNAKVDVDKVTIRDAANEFLTAENLL